MLRLKIRLVRENRTVETLAIANSGFIGTEPEVMLPIHIAEELTLTHLSVVEYRRRALADGTIISLPTYTNALDVYAVTEDRVVGPIRTTAYVTTSRHVLLNDKLLGKLGIVCLDFGEGIWCFRDELGKKVRYTL
ncbi:MAG: hypothetical protein DRN15_04930 [Thermoprotei archaeon]|nr:MAG: hypothetical protein DRN15_04930 [Thermoprotei archaeon]RLF25617.1 MAG: hypothetical protein DRM97_01215 [Thermoprotei archaeon]